MHEHGERLAEVARRTIRAVQRDVFELPYALRGGGNGRTAKREWRSLGSAGEKTCRGGEIVVVHRRKVLREQRDLLERSARRGNGLGGASEAFYGNSTR